MIKPTRNSEIKRFWHKIDADGQILGRLSSKIIPLLIGKNKPYFVRNLDCGDYVVIVNAAKIRVTGKKELQKTYYNYSGYPGGLRESSFLHLKQYHPEQILERAVLSMLPKNKMRNLWLKKLHIFSGTEHPYEDKFKVKQEKLKEKEKGKKPEVTNEKN